MKRIAQSAVVVVAVVTLHAPCADGQDGLLGRIAAAPFAVADGALRGTAGAVGGVADLAGQTAEEAAYVSGDAVEFVYRVHPVPRVGRFVGLLPEGKLGLLPSHDEPVFPLNKVQRLLTREQSHREAHDGALNETRGTRRTQLVLVARTVRHTTVARSAERPVSGRGRTHFVVRTMSGGSPRHESGR